MRCIRDELAACGKLLPYLEAKLAKGLTHFQSLHSGDIAPASLDGSCIVI
jgi:hypothetical protein